MILVYQVDNRFGQDKLLDWASKSVKKSALSAGAKYHKYNDNLGESFREGGQESYYYSKLALLSQYLNSYSDGDIIIYVDSDMVLEKSAISKLLEVVNDNPSKTFFITSIITAYNGGIFAVKVNYLIRDILKKILSRIQKGEYPEFLDTKFGKIFLPDEIPFDFAILNNEYNINSQTYYLDTEVFNCLPPYMFPNDQPDYLPIPSNKTLAIHYTGTEGKERLKSRYKENL